jgi:hypothetical protein
MWKVQMGLTAAGLDHLGDVTAIERVSSTSTTAVTAGDTLLQIQWEGYTHTAADELYHTVWESIEGTTVLQSPVTGTLMVGGCGPDNDEYQYEDPTVMQVDDDTVLAQLCCTHQDLTAAAHEWVDQDAYERFVATQGAGRFAD